MFELKKTRAILNVRVCVIKTRKGRMEEQVRKLDSFPAEDGHIESVLVGVQEVKVSFQDWRGRKLVILFHDVEEFHGFDTSTMNIN